MESPILPYIRELASRSRLLLLGGHAIIFHGLDRPTTDSDVWLDSTLPLEDWCGELGRIQHEHPESYFWDLAEQRKCSLLDLPEMVTVNGVVRVGGLAEPLDIFRRPNNFKESEFDVVWAQAAELPKEQVRVFSAIDLLLSKAETERQKDMLDAAFLEGKIRKEYGVLRSCGVEEAQRRFARYADHETCRAALENPHAEVRDLALETLRELALGQNPFAREILAERGEAVG